jgi:hypothetical protein
MLSDSRNADISRVFYKRMNRSSSGEKKVMAIQQGILREDFVVAEYKSLRSEINNRITIMYQIFSFTLVAYGAILTVAFSGSVDNRGLVLIYPYVACFAAIIYLSNISVIHNLGRYIRKVIEPLMDNQYEHWEERIQERSTYGYHFYYILAGFTTFIITPLLALIIYARTTPQYEHTFDLYVNPFFTLASIILFIILVLMLHNWYMVYPHWHARMFR